MAAEELRKRVRVKYPEASEIECALVITTSHLALRPVKLMDDKGWFIPIDDAFEVMEAIVCRLPKE